jgi:hypothetical protein
MELNWIGCSDVLQGEMRELSKIDFSGVEGYKPCHAS